jgi:hypothetical protein
MIIATLTVLYIPNSVVTPSRVLILAEVLLPIGPKFDHSVL